jgi:hypothetical protein
VEAKIEIPFPETLEDLIAAAARFDLPNRTRTRVVGSGKSARLVLDSREEDARPSAPPEKPPNPVKPSHG